MMNNMKNASRTLLRATVVAVALSTLGACAVTPRQAHAGIGAAAGGALGYAITGGPLGTAAGAVAGGVIGAGVR